MIFNGAEVDLRLPSYPKTLQRAVKDHNAWMKDIKKPLEHPNFQELKRRVVTLAIEAVAKDLIKEG
jgi:hypothetical protein